MPAYYGRLYVLKEMGKPVIFMALITFLLTVVIASAVFFMYGAVMFVGLAFVIFAGLEIAFNRGKYYDARVLTFVILGFILVLLSGMGYDFAVINVNDIPQLKVIYNIFH